ncbi:MAG: hypothetical protein RBR67_16090 [Desulfobacterium sp.]|nr:hypothetical protein [Desulfobacterium sp.]
MAVQFTNRICKQYYLREGKTKTGKPRYFFSAQQKGKGEIVDQIPAGYEIYEHPENAQVFLRKIRPQLITDREKQLVEKAVKALQRSKRYIVDFKDKDITIYESSVDVENIKKILSDSPSFALLRSGNRVDDVIDMLVGGHYMAMLRFHLENKEQRTFTVERFCFRGAIDDWIYLDGPENLQTLIDMHVELLGTDGFYDSLPY